MTGLIESSAIRLQPAFDDPVEVRSFVEEAGPFETLALAAQTKEERERSGRVRVPFIPPWFRRDLATHGEVHVDGGQSLLDHAGYREAAARVYPGASIVEPTTVYVNVMGPAPYPFIAHIDVPVFVTASRRNCPVWLLHTMFASQIFEQERVRVATAVSWFFDGPGGSFHYWPDGPDNQAHTESAPFDNVAVVADNEAVYHGVGPLGPEAVAPLEDLSVDAVIEHDRKSEQWTIQDPHPVMTYEPSEVRITISWKAEVFTNEDERAARHEGRGAQLPIDDIVERFMEDLRAKGLDPAEPGDPLHDPEWIDLITDTYSAHRAPRIPS